MCGIFGFSKGLSLDNNSFNLISHRGPDASSFFQDYKIFLGHKRLSIIDLSEVSNQPLWSLDKRFCIIYNGELYNYKELKSRLIEKGFIFRTEGDTEVILNSFIKFKEAAFNLFNGIFSFCIYDTLECKLWLVRDHFGVKPLYYYYDGNKIAFSSELKAINNLGVSLNHQAFLNYITYLYSPGEATPFNEIKKLEPGNYIKYDLVSNDFVKIKYYELPFLGGYFFDFSEKQLIDKLEEQLYEAVKLQLIADVNIGFFLSGGLDSSLLVAIAKKHFNASVGHCFTISNNERTLSEGFIDDYPYAKKIANILSVELVSVPSNIDIINQFDKMIWHLDEPQGDIAPIHVYNISKKARDLGYKVLIGGTAGDDVFSGYRRHIIANYFNYIKRIGTLLSILPLNYFDKWFNVPTFRRINKLIEPFKTNGDERTTSLFEWLNPVVGKELFLEKNQDNLNHYLPNHFFLENLKNLDGDKNGLNRCLYTEFKGFLPDHNLNYSDKMGMAASIEIRVPYLDKNLVEFSTMIPPHFKVRGLTTKYLLRKVAERYLPKDIIYRSKTGFGVPLRSWLREDLKGFVSHRLSRDRIEEAGIFDYKRVQNFIIQNGKGVHDSSYSILALIAIDSWYQQFYKNKKYL
jgi:asparagine synthase (glutamine-hydrolysing)